MDNLAAAVEIPSPDRPDPKAHLARPDNLDNPANPARLVNRRRAAHHNPDHLAHLDLPAHPATLVAPDNPVTMDNPADPDPKAHLAAPALPATLEAMDILVPLEIPAVLATAASARNIAPSMVAFSSRTERVVVKLGKRIEAANPQAVSSKCSFFRELLFIFGIFNIFANNKFFI
jgi:hypothetical protein